MCSFVKWNIEVNITLQRGSRKLIHPVHYTCSQWALSNVILDMHCLKIKLSGVGIDAILRPTHHNAMLALCLFVCSSLSALIVILYKYSSLLVEEKRIYIYVCFFINALPSWDISTDEVSSLALSKLCFGHNSQLVGVFHNIYKGT